MRRGTPTLTRRYPETVIVKAKMEVSSVNLWNSRLVMICSCIFVAGSKSPLLIRWTEPAGTKDSASPEWVSFDPSGGEVRMAGSGDMDMQTYEAVLKEDTRELLTADRCKFFVIIGACV